LFAIFISLIFFPGSAPHVEFAKELMDSDDPSVKMLRSFQDRLNRRIDKVQTIFSIFLPVFYFKSTVKPV
jgi:hypothetical protein